jgi:hypothetical protein
MGKYINSFNQKLHAAHKKSYIRAQHSTYMSATEWRNVEMAIEYGEFLAEAKSIFTFPYFRQIIDMWRIVGKSYRAAHQHEKAWPLIKSDYMVMNVMIAIFTTMELLPKGILSLLLWPLMRKPNPSLFQSALGKYYREYGELLKTVQFYDHDHDARRLELKQAYKDSPHKTWTDWFSLQIVSLELRAKKVMSKIVRRALHGSSNDVTPDTTQLLVKYKDPRTVNDDAAKQQFMNVHAAIPRSNNVKCDVVNNDVYVKPEHPGKTYRSVYARLSVPRYMAFKQTLPALHAQGLEVKSIAGNDHVQVKCIVDAENKTALQSDLQALSQLRDVKLNYTYADRIHPFKRFCMFDVPVKSLDARIADISRVNDTKVEFIHNF